ncbi:MAG: glutamine--fructose-6-phosphate transaminase (isomerizing), partial [bacterium]
IKKRSGGTFMCGIVGFFGSKNAKEVILSGLYKLEYRGYDSAGMALLNNANKIDVFKTKGRVNELENITTLQNSTFGIGHTRWATHGEPNYINSHPHYSESKRFVIVHNGVIENSVELKVEVLNHYNFASQTDTEVIANLIDHYSKKMSVEKAIRKTMSTLEGSYALIIIDTEDLNKMYVAKNKTPLLIGVAEEGVTIASDLMALVGFAKKYISLEDQTFGVISNNDFELFDIIGVDKEKELKEITLKDEDVSKGDAEHFMIKEIEEQPNVIRNLITNYFDGDNIKIDPKLIKQMKESDKINLVACGTSMYSCYMAKYYFEKLAGIPSEVFCASELVYSTPLITKKPFFVFVSQSGETADSIAVMKRCKDSKYPMLAITNSIESSMYNLANYHLHINAGKEISVASTKAYIAQIVTTAILAKELSGKQTSLKENLNKIALVMEKLISNKAIYKDLASKMYNQTSAFYLGRGIDYWTSLEAALKLKEISYIHTEAYPSGELKHGPIALITKDTPVIAIITQEGTNMITRSNLAETEARGANTFVISMQSLSNTSDDIVIPNVAHYLTPLVSAVVVQYISYYCAILNGNDVDKPRNLAKSVTVE